MLDFVTADSGAWSWLIVGLVLVAAETQAPGAFLIWIGLAAMTTGAIEMVAPLGLTWTIVTFAVLVLGFGFLGRMIYGNRTRREAEPLLNQRLAALVGREFRLDQPIENGFGRIRVNDSVWRVAGPELPAGARVKVLGAADGTVLAVAPVP